MDALKILIMSVGAAWFLLTVGPCTSLFLRLSVVVQSLSSPSSSSSSSHLGRPSISLDDAADPALETSTALRLVHHGHGALCSALNLRDVHHVQSYNSYNILNIQMPKEKVLKSKNSEKNSLHVPALQQMQNVQKF